MNKLLSGREQKIFLMCVAAVFTALLYNGVIVPLQEHKRSLDEQIAVGRKQLQQNLTIIEKARGINQRYDQYIRDYLVSGSEQEAVSSILSDIQKVAGQLKIHVTDLKPGQLKGGASDNHFTVSLTINSELIDIIRFCHTVQQAPHLLDIQRMEFQQTSRRGQEKLTAQLTLGKTFILSDKKKAAL